MLKCYWPFTINLTPIWVWTIARENLPPKTTYPPEFAHVPQGAVQEAGPGQWGYCSWHKALVREAFFWGFSWSWSSYLFSVEIKVSKKSNIFCCPMLITNNNVVLFFCFPPMTIVRKSQEKKKRKNYARSSGITLKGKLQLAKRSLTLDCFI